MNTIEQPTNANLFAFRQGLIYGVGIAVIIIILGLLATFADLTFLAYFNWLVWTVGLFAVGFVSAKATGKVSTGTISGLWAGFIGGIIDLVYQIIVVVTSGATSQTASQIHTSQAASQIHTSASAVMIAAIVLLVVALAVEVGLGAGIGAIGGVLGKSQAKNTPQYVQE